MNKTHSSLINTLHEYLYKNHDHEKIAKFVWELAENLPKETPNDFKVFWSTVFNVIHLADAEHWQDNCTKKTLENLIEKLRIERIIAVGKDEKDGVFLRIFDWELKDYLEDILNEKYNLEIEYFETRQYENWEMYKIYFHKSISLEKLEHIIESIDKKVVLEVYSLNNSDF